jgi:hypothetical protein
MWVFIEIIDNKKLEENDGIDDVYIMHVKRYAIRTYRLERWYDTWWCVHIVYQENYI